MLLSNSFQSRWAKGIAVALLAFGGLGTVSALWNNPLFMRMTPAGGWEIGLLGALLLLFGGELLLTYFEPVRIYVAAVGTAILAVAVVIEGRRGLSLALGQIARPASHGETQR
jgi:hypothetical protein